MHEIAQRLHRLDASQLNVHSVAIVLPSPAVRSLFACCSGRQHQPADLEGELIRPVTRGDSGHHC